MQPQAVLDSLPRRHLFRVMKRQLGDAKVRYRGLAKSGAQVFRLIEPTSLSMKRRQLMA